VKEKSSTGICYERLRRILKGKNRKEFSEILDFDEEMRILVSHLPEEFPPEIENNESAQFTWDRWVKGFRKNEQLVLEFLGIWAGEITYSLLTIHQAGNLLVNPIRREERVKRNIKNLLEWYNLVLTLYFDEIYILKCRLIEWLKKFERRFNNKNDPFKKNRVQVKSIRNAIESYLEGIVKTRGNHIHSRRFQDHNLYAMELYETAGKVKLKLGNNLNVNYVGNIISYANEFKRDWGRTLAKNERHLFQLLNTLMPILRKVIYYLCPRFKQVVEKDRREN